MSNTNDQIKIHECLSKIWDKYAKDKKEMVSLPVRGNWKFVSEGHINIKKLEGAWFVSYTTGKNETHRPKISDAISAHFSQATGERINGTVHTSLSRDNGWLFAPLQESKIANELANELKERILHTAQNHQLIQQVK